MLVTKQEERKLPGHGGLKEHKYMPPGRLSGKGLVSRHTNSFHLAISARGAPP